MKKRLQKGEVRAIKIDEEALDEFIRECIIEKNTELFDLHDRRDTECCMRWNKEDNSFTCITYNLKDRSMVDFDAIDDDLDVTTRTMFTKRRYVIVDLAAPERVLEKYTQTAAICGKTWLFPADTMLNIIEDCKKANLRIFGFDGFRIEGEGCRPFMKYSPDYSNITDKSAIYDMAKDFITENKDLGLLFEIVI